MPPDTPAPAEAVARQPSPAVSKLVAAADEVLTIARQLQADGRHADAVACALFANEYVRAARAMQDMEDASNDR